MGRKRKFPPRKIVHKGGEQLKWGGKTYYLGPAGSEKAKQRYLQLLQIWQSDPFAVPVTPTDFLVSELCREYLVAAPMAPGEKDKHRRGIELLLELHSETPVERFGPQALAGWRDWLAERKPALSRAYIGHLLRYTRAVWKWGVERERVPAATWHALLAVRGLRADRGKPPRKTGEVTAERFRAVVDQLPASARGLLELLRFTGARPSEVCGLRPVDVDKSALPWRYSPREHKTAGRGKSRTILFGPKARAVLVRHEPRGENVPYFLNRRGSAYNRNSIHYLIARLCKRTGTPGFSPYSLRHQRATEVRAEHGIEAAGAVLGHSRVSTTELYARRNEGLAERAAEETG